MENIHYEKLLIDSDIWESTIDHTKDVFSEWYTSIIIASEKLKQMKKFMNRPDRMEYLYISQSLLRIYIMQQRYQMHCCLINNGFNDILDIDHIHEVKSLEDVQKVL